MLRARTSVAAEESLSRTSAGFLVAIWFDLLLPSLQLIVSDRIPPAERARAENTLVRLHLRDDERVIRQRSEWYRMYKEGEINLDGLRKKAPLLARAIEKQER